MKPRNKSLISWKQDLPLSEIERQKNKCPLVGGSFYRRQSTVILEGLPHPPVSCPTLCDPVGCSPPGSSVHGILQARILEWVAMSFSRGSSWPRDQTLGLISCIAGRFFTIWVTREAHKEVSKVRLGTFSRDLTAHCTTSQPGRSSGRQHWIPVLALQPSGFEDLVQFLSSSKPFPLLSHLQVLVIYANFWPHPAACGILVPLPGIQPTPPALAVQSLNHWTTKEAPHLNWDHTNSQS